MVDFIYRYSPRNSPARPRPVDSDAATRRLEEGNRAFAALLDTLNDDDAVAQRVIDIDPQDLGIALGSKAGAKQRPFAAVLGCSDALVPIELIFN